MANKNFTLTDSDLQQLLDLVHSAEALSTISEAMSENSRQIEALGYFIRILKAKCITFHVALSERLEEGGAE